MEKNSLILVVDCFICSSVQNCKLQNPGAPGAFSEHGPNWGLGLMKWAGPSNSYLVDSPGRAPLDVDGPRFHTCNHSSCDSSP